jgi:hypothetical protein
MAHVINDGSDDNHNFTFLGLTKMISAAKEIQTYYLNTSLDGTNFGNLATDISTYNGFMTKMQVNVNKVYNDPLVYYGVQVPDVNSSNVYYVNYLKVTLNHQTWGNTTNDNNETGLWATTYQSVWNGYFSMGSAASYLMDSGNPIISKTT